MDTISFDTLLSNRRSNTQRLTIYNPNQEALKLDEIRLSVASDFSAIINGKTGSVQTDQFLSGGDSLLLLIQIFARPQNLDQLYHLKDSIIVSWNQNVKDIKLHAWVQDVTPIRNQTICDKVWDNTKPYLISDTLLVQKGCQLQIENNTKVYFENDAILLVEGTLIVHGDTATIVEFTNSRFDSGFDQVPGQWKGIFFMQGSHGDLSFAKITNADVGLWVNNPDDDNIPDITLNSVEIAHMSSSGILAFTSDVSAVNTLIYNCRSYLIGNFAGGNYSYKHCTFTNESSYFIHDDPSIQFSDNLVLPDGTLQTSNLKVEIQNSILWSNVDELVINAGGDTDIQLMVSNNIISSRRSMEDNFTSDMSNYPGFVRPYTFDFRLDKLSPAINQGTQLDIRFDIRKHLRDDMPDIGAFERN